MPLVRLSAPPPFGDVTHGLGMYRRSGGGHAMVWSASRAGGAGRVLQATQGCQLAPACPQPWLPTPLKLLLLLEGLLTCCCLASCMRLGLCVFECFVRLLSIEAHRIWCQTAEDFLIFVL